MVELERATVPHTDADAAVGIAALGIAQALKAAAMALLDGTATTEQRDAARLLVRAARGIPDVDDQPEAVVCLNLAGWIEQAREEQHDHRWLQRHALSVEPRFERVAEQAWKVAVSGPARSSNRKATKPSAGAVTKGTARGAIIEAAKLVTAAGLHTDANVLAATASSLRWNSRKRGP